MNPATMPIAFSAEDAERAYREWGANCGPGALAAALGWSLDRLRPFLGDFERRGYMNVPMMRVAILATGHRWADPNPRFPVPMHGVARIQWGGSWMQPGVPEGARASRTHWVATKAASLFDPFCVFDINAGWLTLSDWEDQVVPRIVAAVRGCDGTFEVTHKLEVRKAKPGRVTS